MWKGLQLVSIVLRLADPPFRREMIDPDNDDALADRRVLHDLERTVGHAVQVSADVEPLDQQLQLVQILHVHALVHHQVLHTVVVELDLERILAAQMLRLRLCYLDLVVVGHVHALLPTVRQATVEPVRPPRSAE